MGQKRIIELDEKLAIESGDVLIMDNESSGSSKISAANLMQSKQDKTDNSLNTTSKQVVGAINELKSLSDLKQNITDNALQTTSKQIVGAINELETELDSVSADKQDKADNSLNTTSKQIVGAINELKNNVDNTYTQTETDTALALKQNITDNSLQTTSKQIVGAINELIAALADYYTITQTDTALAAKQNITDSSLDTTSKQIVGAINELLGRFVNYYTKSEVNDLVDNIQLLNIEVVQTLPTTDIDTHTIYFVPKPTPSQNDVYDEYMYVNNTWDLIGTTEVDLTNYYNKSEVDTLLAAKQNTLTFDSTPTANSNNPVKSGGIKTALDGKAPNSHASSSTTYGVGTTANYGHVKVINGLTQSAYADGEALAAYQGKVLNDAIAGKAPTSHASSATTYGVGTTANYGHVKVINGLTQSAYANGEALAAYQGKVLNDKIAAITPAALGFGKGTCGTAATTAAKAVTLSGYNLVAGGIIAVKFTYAVPASATLNVNSKGAKSIYYRGAAITAGIIDAGDTAVFIYNGTQYDLLTTDKLMSMHF